MLWHTASVVVMLLSAGEVDAGQLVLEAVHPARDALEPAGHALEPAGHALEPAGHAVKADVQLGR
jgi:hypothetical protein